MQVREYLCCKEEENLQDTKPADAENVLDKRGMDGNEKLRFEKYRAKFCRLDYLWEMFSSEFFCLDYHWELFSSPAVSPRLSLSAASFIIGNNIISNS